MLILTALACGGSDGPIRSERTTPTAEIGGKVLSEPEIVWSELTEVFPTTPGRPPVRLATLVPGTKGAEARAALDAAHLAGTGMFAEQQGDELVVATLLDGHPNVGLKLLLDAEGETLRELRVSVPKDEALAVLAARWGEPDATDFRPEGGTIYRWNEPGAPWAVEILPPTKAGDDKAIIRYSRP